MSSPSPYTPPAQSYVRGPRVAGPVAPVGGGLGLEDQVMAGTRFIRIPYVMSGVIISYRNSGELKTVRKGEWPASKLIVSTLITSTIGWLGFPRGMIFTAMTLPVLWNGGKDVTRSVLEAGMGPQHAARIMAAAPKPETHVSVWIARGIILLMLLLIGFVVYSIATAGHGHHADPVEE